MIIWMFQFRVCRHRYGYFFPLSLLFPPLSFLLNTSPFLHSPNLPSLHSTPPNPHNSNNPLPTNRTLINLPRTLFTSSHMPTIIKQRIHLHFKANLTQQQVLVRNLELHRPFTMPLPLHEPPRVYVSRFGVDHFAGTVGFVGFPFAGVGVAVGVVHCAVAGFDTGGEGAGVGISIEGDEGASAVESPVDEGAGGVIGAEVGVEEVGTEIGWIVVAFEIRKVFLWRCALAFILDGGYAASGD